MLLRCTLGPMLIVHGVNKIAGPGGIAGTTSWFESLGLRPPWLHARLAAATEIASGTLMTIGALAPWPEAAAIGLMATAAATDHRGKGFFIFKGGWEYVGVVGASAAALAGLGHGRWSIDAIRSKRRSGMRWALVAAGAGLAGAVGLVTTSYRAAQPTSAQPSSSDTHGETHADPGLGGTAAN